MIYHDDRSLSPQACTPDGRYLLLIARTGTSQGTAFAWAWPPPRPRRCGRPTLRLRHPRQPGRTLGSDYWAASRILPYPFSATASANPQSLPCARAPFFNPDGKTIYGLNAGFTGIIAQALLPAADGRGIRLGEPSFLFPIQTSTRGRANVASISRDNKRILAISADPSEELKTQVLTDWTTLLPSSR